MEQKPGEYWGEEDSETVLHSMFTDGEANRLVSNWEVVSKYKQIRYLRETALETSLPAWMELYSEVGGTYSLDDWQLKYECRADLFQYSHL
jgi:hypothetical protein